MLVIRTFMNQSPYLVQVVRLDQEMMQWHYDSLKTVFYFSPEKMINGGGGFDGEHLTLIYFVEILQKFLHVLMGIFLCKDRLPTLP